MKYTILESNEEPVTLEQIKEWLVIDHNHHDELLNRLIKASIRYVENFTGMSVVDRRWKIKTTPAEIGTGFILAYNPVISIDSVEIDTHGERVELTDDQYVFEVKETNSFIVVLDQTILRNAQDARATFVVEFTVDPNPVSDALRHGIIMMVAWYYENRGDTSDTYNNHIPPEVAAILESERKAFV